jgi:hypothetical protein
MSQVAQSVQCLATGWTTRRSRFNPRQKRKDFSSSLCIHTGSGAHPASCTMGTRDPFPGVKRGQGTMLTTHPHLILRSRMSRSCTSSPPSTFVACSGTAFMKTLFWNSPRRIENNRKNVRISGLYNFLVLYILFCSLIHTLSLAAAISALIKM